MPRSSSWASAALATFPPYSTSFAGPENRNGRRNHNEIRLRSDYLNGDERANHLVDDSGKSGGLHSENFIVILGDLNVDPVNGESYDHAIHQLLEHKRIHPAVCLDERVPRREGAKLQKSQKRPHRKTLLKTQLLGG